MYIDNSYFSREINIPHKTNVPNSNRVGNSVSLQSFIDTYEVEIMLFALGNPLFDEFNDQFDTNTGAVKGTAPDKWKKFIEVGEEYQISGVDYKWRGLRYIDGTAKKSLIADYVYYKFLEDQAVKLGGLGLQTEDANNATVHSTIPKLTNVWNEFVKKYQGENLSSTGPSTFISGYGSVIGVDYASSDRNYLVSMYQYLLDKKVDFPNFKTKLFKMTNSFGI